MRSNNNNSISSKIPRKNEKRERIKSVNTVAARMKQVVEKMIAGQRDSDSQQQVTIFLYKSQQSEIIGSFLHEMRKENNVLFKNKKDLMELITIRYDELVNTLKEEKNS